METWRIAGCCFGAGDFFCVIVSGGKNYLVLINVFMPLIFGPLNATNFLARSIPILQVLTHQPKAAVFEVWTCRGIFIS